MRLASLRVRGAISGAARVAKKHDPAWSCVSLCAADHE
jgi:hypothetical protein